MFFINYTTKSLNTAKKNINFLSDISLHLGDYPTPINLSYLWSFGALAGVTLSIQIVTGLLLSMHYAPHVDLAFDSVEHIMRDVNFGWLFRYTHANGASIFFIAVYSHMFKNLYFKAYKRKLLWYSGLSIYIILMATAFLGYVLPWGQMSFWGVTVICNFVTAIPNIGVYIAWWIWGGFAVNNATLNRFFSLHFLLPFLLLGLVIAHIGILHIYGSKSPLGFEAVKTVYFYPYFWLKDFFGVWVLLFVLMYLVCFEPNLLGHTSNYIPANPLSTPTHIVPEWYFLPFYAILRSIPDKLGGVVAMAFAIVILFFLPFLDTTYYINTTRYLYLYKFMFWFFFSDAMILGWIGSQPVVDPYLAIGLYATQFYFFFFLVILPFSAEFDNGFIQFKNHPYSVINIIPVIFFSKKSSWGSINPARKLLWPFDVNYSISIK